MSWIRDEYSRFKDHDGYCMEKRDMQRIEYVYKRLMGGNDKMRDLGQVLEVSLRNSFGVNEEDLTVMGE